MTTSNSEALPPPESASVDAWKAAEKPARARAAPLAGRRTRLPAVLSTRDLIVLMVLEILWITNVGSVQFGGPVVFLYWGVGFLTNLVPTAFVVQWLGRRFPGQGAPYLWANQTLGISWSFVAAFCTWWPGILLVIPGLFTTLAFVQDLTPAWTPTPTDEGLVMLGLLCVLLLLTCVPLRWLKTGLLVVTLLYLVIFLLVGGAGLWWVAQGHREAVAVTPSSLWQGHLVNVVLYGWVVVALWGVDLPLFLGGEIRGGSAGRHRATRYVWWGAAVSMVVYVLGTFGVMVVVPPGDASGNSSSIEAIQLAFGATVAHLATVGLLLSFLAICAEELLVFSRLLVVVAQDRRLPEGLTKLNRFGVPVRSLVVQAVVTAGVIVVIYVLIPNLFGGGSSANEISTVAIISVMPVAAISQALIFVFALWELCRPPPERQRVSGHQRSLLWVASVVGLLSLLLWGWAVFAGSWLPSLISDERWATLMVVVVVASLGLGWLGGEVPRVHALLRAQQQQTQREAALRAQLQQALTNLQVAHDELAALATTFLTTASHELRTPLTSILGSIEIAGRQLPMLQEQARALAEPLVPKLERLGELQGLLTQQSQRLRRLVEDMLDTSRIEAGQLSLVKQSADLREIVQAAVEQMEQIWQGALGCRIDCQVPEQAVPVEVDVGRIEQVVMNYLSNALKYAPEEGRVEVEVKGEEGQGGVWVRDGGPGMVEAEQERIWERFYQVPGVQVQRGSYVGLGLGLHISRVVVVELHGGQVGVESRPGEGATFWFTLPLSSAGPTSPPEA